MVEPARVSQRAVVVVSIVALGCGGGEATGTPPATSPTAKATGPDGTSATDPASATSNPASSAPAPSDGAWPFGAQSAEDRTAQLERLKKDAGPIKSNWVPPGKSDRYGHAEALIAAPPDAVKAKLADFGHYKDLAGPKFKSVKVVDKQGTNTDVYFQLPIMKGIVTIWYITRFPPPRGDVIEGTYVKGNIKGMHIAFAVKPGPDEKSSVFVCDLVLQPNVPAPQSALDEELRDACGDAVHSLRRTVAGGT
jgi:hypothetical protein